jgi:hypothetical protein
MSSGFVSGFKNYEKDFFSLNIHTNHRLNAKNLDPIKETLNLVNIEYLSKFKFGKPPPWPVFVGKSSS